MMHAAGMVHTHTRLFELDTCMFSLQRLYTSEIAFFSNSGRQNAMISGSTLNMNMNMSAYFDYNGQTFKLSVH